MPLVRISLRKGRAAEFRRKLGDAVHRALVDTIGVPEKDRFQVLTEHEPGDLVYDPGYLGIARTGDIVIVQLTISTGRTLAQKRALFKAIADNFHKLGVRREDAWINLVEVAKENWSFGLGEASYAPAETVPARTLLPLAASFIRGAFLSLQRIRMRAPLSRSAHVQGRSSQG